MGDIDDDMRISSALELESGLGSTLKLKNENNGEKE